MSQITVSLVGRMMYSSSSRHETLRDQQGKIGIHMAQFLELVVQGTLDIFPDGVAVGTDHHAAADRAVVGQFGRLDDVQIPAAVVLASFRDLGHRFPFP